MKVPPTTCKAHVHYAQYNPPVSDVILELPQWRRNYGAEISYVRHICALCVEECGNNTQDTAKRKNAMAQLKLTYGKITCVHIVLDQVVY